MEKVRIEARRDPKGGFSARQERENGAEIPMRRKAETLLKP
jgi:hypothetical protein